MPIRCWPSRWRTKTCLSVDRRSAKTIHGKTIREEEDAVEFKPLKPDWPGKAGPRRSDMDVQTFHAASLQEALDQVRQALGQHASVLQTREVPVGWLGWLTGRRHVEVTASIDVHVPSLLPSLSTNSSTNSSTSANRAPAPTAERAAFRDRVRQDVAHGAVQGRSLVEELCAASESAARPRTTGAIFLAYSQLLDAEVAEDVARDIMDRVRGGLTPRDAEDPLVVQSRLQRCVEERIPVSGPIAVAPGRRRVVALVGPTGVGKTTTIAKLAANFRLREHRRVGLITVDTYRIAAVEQLRTYADIIDLPMEVVATPREMKQALARLADLDLVLLDTAGRSPQDEARIQELQAILAESQPDEVHLVLSSVASLPQLSRAARQFGQVGVTSLVMTKLDEATGLGNLLSLLGRSNLPISYVTHGQNVPDDIEPADRRQLARQILETRHSHA